MGLTCGEMADALSNDFAPWIQSMNIEPMDITVDGAVFKLPSNSDLVRGGDILCGQALASLADTVCVLTLFGHNDERRLLTTIDMNTQFLRPLGHETVIARTVIQANGKRMAQVRCEMRADTEGAKLAASAACTFLYI